MIDTRTPGSWNIGIYALNDFEYGHDSFADSLSAAYVTVCGSELLELNFEDEIRIEKVRQSGESFSFNYSDIFVLTQPMPSISI